MHQSIDALLTDATFLLKLRRKVALSLVSCSSSGLYELFRLFEKVDAVHKSAEAVVDQSALFSIVRPSFPATVFSDRELQVLIELARQSTGGDGGGAEPPIADVSPSTFCYMLRKILPFHAWQLSSLLSTCRAKIFESNTMSGLEEHESDLLRGGKAPALRTREVASFLVGFCNLSGSQAQIAVDYFSLDSKDKQRGDAAFDVPLLYDALFAEEMPVALQYPLLAQRFTEATAVPLGQGARTGSLALAQALQRAGLCPAGGTVAACRGSTAAVELAAWKRVCAALACGMKEAEVTQLYEFLRRGDRGLTVAGVMQFYKSFFPSVGMSVLDIITTATRTQIVKQGETSLVELFNALEGYGTDRIPLEVYISAVRDAATGKGAIPLYDIDLEYVRLKAPTRVQLLLLLCGPVPPKRDSLIRKVFERLARDSAARSIPTHTAMNEFKVTKIESEPLQKKAQAWKTYTERYYKSLDAEELTYELFSYVWYMLSAAVEDDPTFTVILWQGYSLAERPPWAK
ncbi:hypothetical protein STCU_08822 [Strigomonas culicis]|uniref:Uncharacterized protein n=1 Tax=Strigomonas culicis TaxID=28005 RepID=S9TW35_9TRYP|nr:hypothetical protein STCU_08822 [Strigomonas culicis]|eukprot:EPY20809.1 hypothetical protein STCU_08822 [Strigomonas culicis]